MANIFQQYLQPVRSITERMADLDAQDIRREQLVGARQQNALQALAMRKQIDADAQARDDQNILRNLYAESGGDQNKLIDLARRTARPGLGSYADSLEKSLLDRRDKESAIKERDTKAAYERVRVIKSAADQLMSNPSPQMAAMALDFMEAQTGVKLPEQRQILTSLQNPEDIRRWALSTSQGADKLLPKFQSIDGGNRVIAGAVDPLTAKFAPQQEVKKAPEGYNIGPDGALSIDPGFLNAKKQIAAAGKTDISINTGQKGLDNEFKLRGEFKQEPVYKAHQEMQAAHGQIKQAIAQASPAGDLAAATKIMKLLDPGSVVRESELGMAMRASGLMDRVTNYGNMVLTGQKLTPKQRKDFQSLADRLMSESVKAYNSKRTEYDKLGSEYGLNAGRALGPESGKADEFRILKVEEK